MNTGMPLNYRQLASAMRQLSDVCDGACREDPKGFNGGDARFGRVLSGTAVSKWSPKMAAAAYAMAVRYRAQLDMVGITVGSIDKPGSIDHRNGGKTRKRVTLFDATIKGETVILSSSAFPGQAAVSAVKSMPGRRFTKTPAPSWHVPVSAAVYLLRAQSDGHIKASDEVSSRLKAVLSGQAQAVQDSKLTDAEFTVEGLGGELMPFQRAGVAYAAKHRRCWIADEMGLGKTVQALATLQACESYPSIIVVPASLKLNWKREVEKWLPMVRRVEVLSGRKPLPIDSGVGVVIINYDILDAWKSTLIALGPKALILDESHYCKTSRARRTKSSKAIARCKTIEVCLLLSGTPVVNSPPDLIAQLNILGRMPDLGGYGHFVQRYCICGEYGLEKGGKNLQELNAKMRAGGMFVRRLKADVLPDLPAKRRSIVSIEIKNRRRYEQTLKRVSVEISRARVHRAEAMRQGFEPEGWAMAASLTGIAELRKTAAECKMDGAMDWIRNMMRTGEKLVIFGHHTAVVERVAKELDCPMIKGGVKSQARQDAVDRFQSDPECRAIVLNLKAGGVGLTLTAASNVVFVESGWTPADNLQAEDRCHRIGQEDSVTAWYLIGENTIDGWMHDLVAKKRLTVDAATDGDEGSQASVVAELSAILEGLGS